MISANVLNVLLHSFQFYATKIVKKTDTRKGAYLPSKLQREVLREAGCVPHEGGGEHIPANVRFVFLAGKTSTEKSGLYYHALRTGAGRSPEPRIGRAFRGLIKPGDFLTIAYEQGQLYALNLSDMAVLTKPSADHPRKSSFPLRYTASVLRYQRSPEIVAQTRARARSKCEMPDCAHSLFRSVEGCVYLEVHHIVPLAEGGRDKMDNTAALCPACHRAQHHAYNRLELRQTLLSMRKRNR